MTPPSRPGPIPGAGTFLYNTFRIMTKKKNAKPKKRGPKEERLVIREDPQSAIDKLLKKKPAR